MKLEKGDLVYVESIGKDDFCRRIRSNLFILDYKMDNYYCFHNDDDRMCINIPSDIGLHITLIEKGAFK